MEVVRADDGGVAADVAETDGPTLEDRDVRNSMLGGQVKRRRESVAAAADDHHAVARARARLRPGALASQSLAQQPPDGVVVGPWGFRRAQARLRGIHGLPPS